MHVIYWICEVIPAKSVFRFLECFYGLKVTLVSWTKYRFISLIFTRFSYCTDEKSSLVNSIQQQVVYINLIFKESELFILTNEIQL